MTLPGASEAVVEYPGLFDAADRAAVAAQKKHFRVSMVDLGLLVFAAVASSFSPADVTLSGHKFDLAAVVTAALLVIGLVTSLVGRIARYDRRWFSARAIAESVKTESWRFLMAVPPHGPADDDILERRRFRDRLSEILAAEPDAHIEIAKHGAEAWIRPSMLQVRTLPLADRAALYRTIRLEEQRKWYSTKAATHRRAEGGWFWAGTLTHAVAVVIALLAIPSAMTLNPMGVLTTIAAGFFAWVQLRDHQHLAQSYTMIAHELAGLEAGASWSSERDLSELVEEVERTISREHTMWVARRKSK